MKVTCGALTAVLILGLLAGPIATEAQQPGKVFRIGFMNIVSPEDAVTHLFDAFKQGLREQGYVYGQNVLFEQRYAKGKYERFPEFAADLVRLKVDIIVVHNPQAALAAKQATSTIPIVMTAVPDPIGLRLVASLARPRGNVTGLTGLPGPEMLGKHLQLLKEVVPTVSRMAVLRNPHTSPYISETQVAARSLGLQLEIVDARGPAEFGGAFATMTRKRVGAVLVAWDASFFLYRSQLADLAANYRLPAMSFAREFVEAGGLMAYAPSLADLFRRAGTYAGRILNGAKPADLPIEQPTKFELVINLKTAKALGLTIPPALLVRADQLIQ
jgi:putative ABC transport system substrate-binding protein